VVDKELAGGNYGAAAEMLKLNATAAEEVDAGPVVEEHTLVEQGAADAPGNSTLETDVELNMTTNTTAEPPTPRPPSRGARYTRTTPGGGARSPSPRSAPPTRAAATAPCAATRVNAGPTCATVVSYLRPGRAGSRRAATRSGILKIQYRREWNSDRRENSSSQSPRSVFPSPPPFSRRPRELDASGGAPVRTRARRLCTNGLTNILLALFRSRRSLSPRRFGSAVSGPSRSSRSSFYALAAPSSAIILALLRSSASLLSAAYSRRAASSALCVTCSGATEKDAPWVPTPSSRSVTWSFALRSPGVCLCTDGTTPKSR